MDSEILLLDLDESPILSSFALENAYPNPFNPTANIGYRLSKNSNIRIAVYDLIGNEVKTLVNGKEHAGSKMIQWDATDQFGHGVSSGVYIYKLEAEGSIETKKMIYLK